MSSNQKSVYEHTYKLKYSLAMEPGVWTKEQINADSNSNVGGTDAFLMFSCIYPTDNSLSVQHHSMDGRTGKEMESSEIFKLWLMIGKALSEKTELGEVRRNLSRIPMEMFREMMKETEKAEGNQDAH